MFAESESDVVAELEMNSNKTIVSTYPSWRCPHHPPLLELESSLTPSSPGYFIKERLAFLNIEPAVPWRPSKIHFSVWKTQTARFR